MGIELKWETGNTNTDCVISRPGQTDTEPFIRHRFLLSKVDESLHRRF